MDINSLSRPYDPDLDDVAPQHFLQGGEVADVNSTGGGDLAAISTPVPDYTGVPTVPRSTDYSNPAAMPAAANTVPAPYDPNDPTGEASRVNALNLIFNQSPGGFRNQVSNAPAGQTYGRNPFVATMPVDPSTGAPGARQDLAQYNQAVAGIPYRAPSRPQTPSMQDFIARQGKGLPALGRKTEASQYDRASNPNYMQFPQDRYAVRGFAEGGEAKQMLKEGEEYVAPLSMDDWHAMIKSTPGGINVVGHIGVQDALKRAGIDPTGMSYKQMGSELSKISPGENFYVVTDTRYSPFVKPAAQPAASVAQPTAQAPAPAPAATTQPAATQQLTVAPQTQPPPPPIVSQADVQNVTGTKAPGTSGPGVPVAPGTNIPFQPLPGTLQTQPAKADLTKFNNAYNNNQNLGSVVGQLPTGFSFDPSRYFQPSQAQQQLTANSGLTPLSLGRSQTTYDRMGNAIAMPVFRAEGGSVDDEDTEASGAKQMMKGYEQLTGPRQTQVVNTPNRQSVRSKQASQIVDQKGRPAGMSMNTSSMTTAQGPASPEQMATAKAMLSDLMRQNMSRKRFAGGGDVSNFKGGAPAKTGAPVKVAKEPEEPGFFDIQDYAAKASTKMFPKQTGADDQRDAARHMLAAALVAKKLGPGMAEFLGKAHERTSNPMSFFNMLGIGEPRYDYPVDVHNNKLGIDLAPRAKTQGELETMVRDMAKTSVNEQQPGRPWTVAPEVVQGIMAKQKKMAETPPEYRADGSPKKGEAAPAPRLTDLEKLTAEAKQYPQHTDLMDYLAARDAVPGVTQTYLGPSTGGQFISGWGEPKNGKIEVNWGASPSTLVHELTHAADRQIGQQALDLKERHRKETPLLDWLRGKTVLTPEEVRLVLGYNKLHFNVDKDIKDPERYPRQATVNKLAPEWAKKNYDYRSADNELVAYGMGSTVPRRHNRAPLHVDPTMATDFSVLLDLAQRAQKAKPPTKE